MRMYFRRMLCILLCLALLPAFSQAEVPSLSTGSQGPSVTRLQKRLSALGLFSGQVDGVYGQQTESWVMEAQRLLQSVGGYDIPPTGQADELTLSLLYSDDPAVESVLRTLCVGSSGDRVRELQNQLIELKMLDGVADGDYGAATEAAVYRFQEQALALEITMDPPTGMADPYTQQLLTQDLGVYGFKAPKYFDETQPLTLSEEYLFCKSCILIDAPTGRVLFEVNSRERMYPASTTKVLTLLTSLEYGNLDKKHTVPESAADVPADSSLVPVNPGERMRKIDLLYGLMLRSGNDAANAIATIDAGDVDSFVGRMNEKAFELGMYDSHFVNPHGYHDPEHYTTAYDLSLATRAGLTDPEFCQIVTCLQYTMPATKRRDALTLHNTYEILNETSPYFIPYAAGVKSGFTSDAGFCFVGAAQYNGRTLIAVILDSNTRYTTWDDLRRLFAYGFALDE